MEAFIVIVSLIWGILSLILFFKVWGMTNDIRQLKQDHFGENISHSEEESKKIIRNNLIIGNVKYVRQSLLSKFIEKVEQSYNSLLIDYKNKNNIPTWEECDESEVRQTDITPLICELKIQLACIGEDLPFYLKNMKTYNDFFTPLFDKTDSPPTE